MKMMPTSSTTRMPAFSAGLCRNELVIGPRSKNATAPIATRPTTIHISCGAGRLMRQGSFAVFRGAVCQERCSAGSRILGRHDVDAIRRLPFGFQAQRAHIHAGGPDFLLEQVLADVDAARQ